MPTLQALLDDASLGLTVHAGAGSGGTDEAAAHDAAGAVAFTAVRSADLPGDRPWLSTRDLRTSETAFTRRRPRPDPLFTPPPAALVYAVTPQRREVPAALVERARRAGTSLLVLPPTVNMARLEAAALRMLAREASEAAPGLGSAQRYLLRALESPKPERELLQRLQHLTGEDAVLVAPWGAVLARAGTLPVVGGERAARLPEGHMRLGGREALVLRVTAGGRLRSVLVAGAERARDLPWLELTRTLLAVTALGREAEARGEQARRAALLAEWLAGPQAAGALAPRLAAAGLEPEGRYGVAVAEAGPRVSPVRSRSESRLDALRAAGDELFQSLGVGALSETRSTHCLWVFRSGAEGERGEALARTLEAAADGAPVRLGLSRAFDDPARVADAYRQAVLALQSVAGPSGTARFEAFDPVYWVLTQQPEGSLRAFRDGLVGALRAADDGRLWRTLVAYLHNADDLRSLAGRLHIHVNTLRYRLRRIEELIGQPLHMPETLARLHLAVQVDAMLERGAP